MREFRKSNFIKIVSLMLTMLILLSAMSGSVVTVFAESATSDEVLPEEAFKTVYLMTDYDTDPMYLYWWHSDQNGFVKGEKKSSEYNGEHCYLWKFETVQTQMDGGIFTKSDNFDFKLTGDIVTYGESGKDLFCVLKGNEIPTEFSNLEPLALSSTPDQAKFAAQVGEEIPIADVNHLSVTGSLSPYGITYELYEDAKCVADSKNDTVLRYTAESVGKHTLKLVLKDLFGNAYDACNFTVYGKQQREGFSFARENTEVTFKSADTIELQQTETYYEGITYTSSDASVASVENGKIKIIKPGEVTIQAVLDADDTYFESKAAYTLRIQKADRTGTLSFQNSAPADLIYTKGLTFQNEAVYEGEDISPVTVEYRIASQDEAAADINKSTGELSVHNAGTVTVEACAEADAYYNAAAPVSYTVNILPSARSEELNFERTADTEVKYGTAFTNKILHVEDDAEVTYSSSAPEIARVDETTGKVVPVKASEEWVTITAKISATRNYKEKEVSYRVKVLKGDLSVALKDEHPAVLTYSEGLTYINPITVKDENGTAVPECTVVYSSKQYDTWHNALGENEVCIISDGGQVSVKRSGIVEVTVKVECENYNSQTAEYKLEINRAEDSGFTFSNTTKDIVYGENNNQYVIGVTGGNSKGKVTYISSVPDAVSIDNTGKITVLKACGQVTITASKAADDKYYASSCSYTFKVEKGQRIWQYPNDFSDSVYYGQTYTAIKPDSTYTAEVTFRLTGENGQQTDTAFIDSASGTVRIDRTGTVLITASIAEDDCYFSANASYRLNIKYLDVSDQIYSCVSGYLIGQENFNGDVTVLPEEEYLISYVDPMDWQDSITITQNVQHPEFVFKYVGRDKTKYGAVSDKITSGISVDKTAPTGTIALNKSSVWSDLVRMLTFGLLGNETPTFYIHFADNTESFESGISADTVYYYIKDDYTGQEQSALTKEDLNSLDASCWQKYSGKETEAVINKYSVIYVKLEDRFNNVSYVSTNGILAENISPEFDVEQKDTNYPFFGYYYEDINVSVNNIEDPGVSSGIQSVKSMVYSVEDGKKTERESFVLYDAAQTAESCKEAYNFTIDVSKVIYEAVYYEIIAEDACGNTKIYKSSTFKVSTKPSVSAVFLNHPESVGTLGTDTVIYKEPLKVQVSIIQQAQYAFNQEDADRCIASCFGDYAGSIEGMNADWTYNNGSYSKILNLKDNRYSLSKCMRYQGIEFPITDIPLHFIIDTTAPSASVSFDNNAPVSGSVYNSGRTATIVVNDDNFVGSESMIEITAADGRGGELPAPKAVWKGNTCTISFAADANYEMRITDAFTDLALNKVELYYANGTKDENRFTVDTAPPENLTVTYSDNASLTGTLEQLIANLTNGYIYFGKDVTVTVSAEDKTSQIDHFIYSAALAQDAGAGSKGIEEQTVKAVNNAASFHIPAEYKGVVFVTAYDTAGNKISSREENGIVVSSKKPEITLQADTGILNSGTAYYNGDITVNVTIEDVNFDSACAVFEENTVYNGSADVKKTSGDQYTWSRKDGTNQYTAQVKLCGGDLQQGKETFTAAYTNHAGHPADQKKLENMVIDRVRPEVKIEYDNNHPSASKGYFYNRARTATVTVADDNFTGSAEMLKVTAADQSGKPIENVPKVRWNGNIGTVIFKDDANYTLTVNRALFTDLAGNKAVISTAHSKDIYTFTLDKTNPTGSITVKDVNGNQIGNTNKTYSENIPFDRYSQTSAAISVTSKDNLTKTGVQIYISEKTLSLQELSRITAWKNYTGEIRLSPDQKFIAYAKITDEAANTVYLSSDGVILDKTVPNIDGIHPEITLTASSNQGHTDKNGIRIYNGDVVVEYTVSDPVSGNTCAGLDLSALKYEVICDGEITQSGLLSGKTTEYEGHIRSVSGTVTVDAQLNNSNRVQLIVYAADNAKNTSSKSAPLMIDITAPEISVSYSNNAPDSQNIKLFKEDRVASISIKERNFDSGNVNISLKKDGAKVDLNPAWSDSGTPGTDSYTHTAQITYSDDGDYVFEITCTDTASNRAKPVEYSDSTAPAEFTIDKTAPKISVTYDNNEAKNGNYYNKQRVASITVVEHNFDASRVECTVTASNGDKSITAPALSSWSHSGDTHTASITYSEDAKYSFSFQYTDMAGNKGNTIETEEFYVDKTAPSIEISGVYYMSANNGKNGNIGYTLTSTDVNFDLNSLNLSFTKVGLSGKDADVLNSASKSALANGVSYTVDNISEDGIYQIVCSVTDKAGNTTDKIRIQDENGQVVSEENVLFSVNREGSTFMINGDTKDLVDTKYLQNVGHDIVITEINPDKVGDYVVTLDSGSSKTKVLTEGKNYVRTENEAAGSWKTYTYTVKADNFAEESAYSLAITSTDKAKNTSYSETKNPEYSDMPLARIDFIVDRTIPQAVVTNIENNGRYNVDKQTVTVIAKDDNLLSSVKVVLNGEVVQEYNADELAESNGELSIDIPSSQTLQDLKVVAADAAKNSTDDSEKTKIHYSNFLVTMDFWVQFINNTGALVITISSIVLVIGGIIFIIAKRRSKKKNTNA